MITSVSLAQAKTCQPQFGSIKKTQQSINNKSDISFGSRLKINPWIAGYVAEGAAITTAAIAPDFHGVNNWAIGLGIASMVVTGICHVLTELGRSMKALDEIRNDME